ncbi:hypothetical protein CAPTEDRAFT_145416, partial [Capitella teleta]
KHINNIQRIQMRATKTLPNLRDLPYSQRLKKLGLPTLTYRQHRPEDTCRHKLTRGQTQLLTRLPYNTESLQHGTPSQQTPSTLPPLTSSNLAL